MGQPKTSAKGTKGGRRGMVTAAVAVALTTIAIAAIPLAFGLSSNTPARARAGVTVFDMFDLSPEQFATLMGQSGE